MPDAPLSALCLDVGLKKTGLAIGNSLTGTARELDILRVPHCPADQPQLQQHIQRWQPACFVLGYPYTADGNRLPIHHHIIALSHALRQHYGKPVYWMDEHLSSWDAEQHLGISAAQAGQLDAAAAVLILESWLAMTATERQHAEQRMHQTLNTAA